MSRLLKTGLGAIVLAGSALLLGSVSGADAMSLSACVDGGSGYCSGSPYGSVTVTNLTSTTATITFNLTTGYIADPADESAVFQLSGNVTGITVGAGSSSSDWNDIIKNGSVQIDADDGSAAFGTFSDGLSCSNSSGCGTTLVVNVTGTGLGLSSVGGYFAALDTAINVQTCGFYGYNGQCYYYYTNTENGAVAAPLSATPLPGALAMLAPVLGGGFLALRRRRRKLSAAAA